MMIKHPKNNQQQWLKLKGFNWNTEKKIDNNFIDYHQHHVVVVVVILCMSNDFES